MLAAGTKFILWPSKTDVFKLWNLADIHLASAACNEKHVMADIEEIRNDPYSFWISTGDCAEFITYSDRRFDPEAVADWVQTKDLANLGAVTYERLRDLFAPIKHKCLGLGLGNHERAYATHNDAVDRHGWLCSELGVQNLTYSAMMHVCFVMGCAADLPGLYPSTTEWKTGTHREAFRLWCHHGAGGAQTKGGKMNRLKKFMDAFDADIYMMGHVHDQTGTRETVLTTNRTGTKITERQKLGVISGGYLKTYSQGLTTYGEVAGYSPTTLGAAWVTVKPATRELAGRI